MKVIPRAVLNGPISLVHFITKNCNARCTHCFIDFDDPKTFADELSVEEIDRLTRRVGWQLRNVNLTGGEPFLRKDIFEIAKSYLTNTGIRSIYITTNGYYTERTAAFLERYLSGGYDRKHTLFFSVSVDDLPAAHDENRKVRGLFQRAIETLRLVGEHRDRRIYANVNLTVIPANYRRIVDIYEYLVTEVGVRAFTTTIMREEGVARIGDGLRSELDRAYRDLNARIKRDLLAGRILGFDGSGLGDLVDAKNLVMRDQIEEAFKTGEFISTCYAGEVFMVLEANGDVRPCEVLPDVIGNVRDTAYDLSAVWRSAQALKTRRFIVDSNCHCTYECAWSLNTLVDSRYYPKLLSNFVRLRTRSGAV